MPRQHSVRPGDCIGSIAFEHGFHPDTIWQHESNAELRTLRDDGYVLLPGDVVVVPDRVTKKVACATGRRHLFRRRGVPEVLKLTLLRGGVARADADYELEVDGTVIATGRTDANGSLQQYIPPNAMKGRVILSDAEVPLDLGALDPVSTENGARARLLNLQYLRSGDATAADYAAALELFQLENQLTRTGVLDEPTQARLLEVAGR